MKKVLQANLIHSAKPIVDEKIEPCFYEILEIKQKPALCDVITHYCKIIRSDLNDRSTIEPIYGFFQNLNDAELRTLSALIYSELKSDNFVFDGHQQFLSRGTVVMESGVDLSPCVLVLKCSSNKLRNDFVKKYDRIYRLAFEIKPSADLSLLVALLTKISKKTKLEKDDKRIIFNIVNYVAENLPRDSAKLLILPVKCNELNKCDFENISKCLYVTEESVNSLESISDIVSTCRENGFKICDTDILPAKLLLKVGVSSYKDKGLNGIENFGQREDLKLRIKKLIDGYSEHSIFKEIIQNADDAQANEVAFCYDMRKMNEWNDSQIRSKTTSLWVFNDSKFTEKDFTNIRNLGSQNKMETNKTIGKFGLGFNSIYNLTDLPAIVSDQTLIIFDPNDFYFKEFGSGLKVNLRENQIKSFNSFLQPYENIFKFKYDEKSFNGTLFRLPLRCQPSQISSSIYDEPKMKNLLSDFYSKLHNMLLFTQNVRIVKFYVIKENSLNVAKDMEMIFELKKTPIRYFRTHEINKNPLENINHAFTRQSNLIKAASQTNDDIVTSFTVKTEITASTNSDFKSNTVAKERIWMISSAHQTSSDVFSLLEKNSVLKSFLPIAGIAVELELNKESNSLQIKNNAEKGQLYCFLPLDVCADFKFHINGCFFITEDRKHLFESSKDSADAFKCQWNSEVLMKPLVASVINAMEDFATHFNLPSESTIKNLWPVNQNSVIFKKFEELFYKTIVDSNSQLFYDNLFRKSYQICQFRPEQQTVE